MNQLPYGEVVDVYWNLHKKLWSVRLDGIVGGRHMEEVYLTWVEFVVGQKGRERVIREGRKNVHAYARGVLCKPSRYSGIREWDARVSYNPYKAGHFVDTHGNPVQAGRIVKLDRNRAVWARGVGYGIAPSQVKGGAPVMVYS
jgi:hypothetical protein